MDEAMTLEPLAAPPLHWRLAWTPGPLESLPNGADATMGVLTIRVGQHLVWSEDDGEWPWIELLEWLARSWIWLRGEEGLPAAVSAYVGASPISSVGDLRRRLRQGTYAEPAGGQARAEMALWDFLETHDLSRALAGAESPPIVIWREGLIAHLLTADGRVTTSWRTVRQSLGVLGDTIAARLQAVTSGDHRSTSALTKWRSRDEVPLRRWLAVARGEELSFSADTMGLAAEEERYSQVERSPVLAVARMTAAVPAPVAADVLQLVAEIPATESGVDRVSESVRQVAGVDLNTRPWEQGYQYALALRAFLGLKSADPFHPDKWLAAWSISVHDVYLKVRTIEAIAIWGPSNGPAVLVNRRGIHSSRPSGRNASLAHEVGHFLMDRDGALPAAEVLGGKVDPLIEQRARAFAAELLLPRSTAGPELASLSGARQAKGAVASLAARFGVSHEIIAWQARNSDSALTEPVLDYLRTLVTYPEHF